MESKGALHWDFPDTSAVIAFADFSNAAFQASLASFLDQASEEVIGRFAGHTNKARSRIHESRETVDPSFITRMLMTLLEVSGHQVQPVYYRKECAMKSTGRKVQRNLGEGVHIG